MSFSTLHFSYSQHFRSKSPQPSRQNPASLLPFISAINGLTARTSTAPRHLPQFKTFPTRSAGTGPHSHHHVAAMAEQSINIPQVLVFLVVTFLVARWYLSKPSAEGSRAAGTHAAPRINSGHIDQVAQMFPQLSRRDIAWDLQRNGGNVAATTERVLSGRGLDSVSITHSLLNMP